MKIGIISTAYAVPTPPATYGGMERVNFWLAQELVRQKHQVVLFGCKGSKLPGAHVVELPGGGEVTPREGGDYPPYFEFMKEWVFNHEPLDIFHDSTHHHEFARRMQGLKSVSTVHNPNWPESNNSIFISNFHRIHIGFPEAPYVMNGCPIDAYPFVKEKQNYTLFMGALGFHKGFDRAIRFAVDYKVPLKIAGHPFGSEEAAVLDKASTYPWIEFLGDIGGDFKNKVLSEAAAILMPFRWPEPGCVIAVEAMACGTPILASHAGVLPEYVDSGTTGFTGCAEPEEIWMAYNQLDQIRPEACYERYLKYFRVERMAQQYLELYQRAIDGEVWLSV